MPNKAYIDFRYDTSSLMDGAFDNCLMITSLYDNNVIKINDMPPNIILYVSTNGGITWGEYKYTGTGTGSVTLATIGYNQSVLIRSNFKDKPSTGYIPAPYFSSTYAFNVSGNALSVYDAVNFSKKTNGVYIYDDMSQARSSALYGLFRNSYVKDASKLELIPTTLSARCYTSMFYGCTSLVSPPELPATTLSDYCYEFMFQGCTSLQYAPVLPSKYTRAYCYAYMFDGCTSLLMPPKLPANTVVNYAYADMFKGCTALQQAPQLPAMNLSYYCYYEMFRGCTSLYSAPELPATSLGQHCYEHMFYDCTNLSYINVAAITRAQGDTDYWAYNVAPSGIFIKSSAATYIIDDPSGVPIGWTLYNNGDVITNMYRVVLNVDDSSHGETYGSGIYPSGTTVKACAYAKEHYKFVNWKDADNNIVSTSMIYSFKIKNNVSLTATFAYDDEDYARAEFCITSLENNNNVYIRNDGNGTLEYSYDASTWYQDSHVNENGVTIIGKGVYKTIDAGDNLYVRGYGVTSLSQDKCALVFHVQKQFNLSGNLGRLFNYSSVGNEAPILSHLFGSSDALIDASNLYIPYTYLKTKCYEWMFAYCRNMIYGPRILPALDTSYNGPGSPINVEYCYKEMFYNCRSLIKAPELPATTLGKGCYYRMFADCWSLTEAPELPATTLKEECYHSMFSHCTSLVIAPELPATIMKESCYEWMFAYCEKMSNDGLPELPATILAKNCYRKMFMGCTSLSRAPELPATELSINDSQNSLQVYAESCYEHMFDGCTGLLVPPVLPATVLAKRCYAYMFKDCTSLLSTPALPATDLSNTGGFDYNFYTNEYCYCGMFEGCTSLKYYTSLPATQDSYYSHLTDGCYCGMFKDCTSLTSIPALPADKLKSYCYSYMFAGCTSLQTVAGMHVPTSVNGSYCYKGMFEGCTNLSVAPNLCANIGGGYYGYMFMFKDCVNLVHAPFLNASYVPVGYYSHMFFGCTKLQDVHIAATSYGNFALDNWLTDTQHFGYFYKVSDGEFEYNSNSGIPTGWRVYTYTPS